MRNLVRVVKKSRWTGTTGTGDGIMSAIDFYLTVGEATGKSGERRVVITFNGASSCRPARLRRPPQANTYSTLSKMPKTTRPRAQTSHRLYRWLSSRHREFGELRHIAPPNVALHIGAYF